MLEYIINVLHYQPAFRVLLFFVAILEVVAVMQFVNLLMQLFVVEFCYFQPFGN